MSQSIPLHNLEGLSSPPGDGISVTQSDDCIRIDISAGISGKVGCFGIPILVFGFVVGCIALGVSLTLLLEFDQPDLGVAAIFAAIGLACFIPACVVFMMLAFPMGIKGTVEITHEYLRISDRNCVVEFPRDDVKSVAVVYMKKSKYQHRARKDWPWLRSRGGGIAVETPHGTVRTLGCWDHEVSRWLAKLISKYFSVQFCDDEYADQLSSEKLVSSGTPYIVPRKNLWLIGLLGTLVAGFFTWGFGGIVRDYFDAKQWQPVIAVVRTIETVESEAKSHLVITYCYEVQDAIYTNNRFRIDDSGYSNFAERRKSELAVGDQIEIWSDLDDPKRSTVRRDFPWAAFVVFLICAVLALAGMITMFYFALARDSILATKYALSPAECKRKQDEGPVPTTNTEE